MTQIWRCFLLIFLYLCPPLHSTMFLSGKEIVQNILSFWTFFFFQSSDRFDFYDCFRYLYGGGWTNIQLICRVWLTCVSSAIYSQESYSSSFRKKQVIIPNLIWKVPHVWSSNLNQSSVSWVFSRHNFTKACFLKEEHVLEVQGNFWEWRKQHEDIQVLHGGVIQNTQSRFKMIFEENVWAFSTDGWLWMIMGSAGIIKWIIYHMHEGWNQTINNNQHMFCLQCVSLFARKKSCIFRLGVKQWYTRLP